MSAGTLQNVALLSFVAFALAEKKDGTCGYQCVADSDCVGCGRKGKCSCPDGLDVTFYQESCTCVSAPDDAPAEPAASVNDAVWPMQWTANVDAWCYKDFTNQTAVASGKFYYDATLGKTRSDWSPYITGSDAKQVWIVDSSKSTYYVKSGLICLKFPITDPGQPGKPQVGIERPDWVKACHDAGYAKYVGREQVHVGDEDVWADHWSCRIDYAAANQSITFQNWHSLGLGSLAKGLPLRVTGGNSAPNPTRGSPRLNSVWYTNFTVGAGATSPSDFDAPNWGIFCIPVGLDDTRAFFGHEATLEHVSSHDFHRRAHFLPHAKPTASDLSRAARPRPSGAFLGRTFGESMRKLNAVLLRARGLRTRLCHNFSMAELHETQRVLFDARNNDLNAVYHGAGDTRRMAHTTLHDLKAEQRRHVDTVAARPDLVAKLRDGACHEMVMWYTHHLSESAREEVKQLIELPLLPEVLHGEPSEVSADGQARNVHARYTEQVSCAICHVKPEEQPRAVVV